MIELFKSAKLCNRAEHEKEIKSLKEEKNKAMERYRGSDISRTKTLADYFYVKFQDGQDIPFNLLDSMEVGNPIPLPVVHAGSILTVKQRVDEEEIIKYDTKWTSGATLTWHYHSDCYEIIIVTEGKFKVYLPDGEKMTLNEGDTLRVANGIAHQVTALTSGKLTIDFIKI